jgi:hypothetical protein
MKRVLIALGIGAAALSLTACADGYYGGMDHGRHYAAYDHHPIGYEGYYDGTYGPFYDGYWGDGGFYYSTGEGRPYVRDEANHFRREGGDGMTAFHGGVYLNRGH